MREYIILYAMPLEKAAERKIELASVHDSGKAGPTLGKPASSGLPQSLAFYGAVDLEPSAGQLFFLSSMTTKVLVAPGRFRDMGSASFIKPRR